MYSIRSISVRVLTACAVILALAVPAFAQPAPAAKATIPFDFQVNGRDLKAGHYRFAPASGNSFLVITSPDGAQDAFLGVPIGEPSAFYEPKLVFEKIGDQYHLTQVWLSNGAGSKGIPLPKAVRELAKRLKSEKTQVALSR
jgi:hypothetical protein